jgi:hypothetical protein
MHRRLRVTCLTDVFLRHTPMQAGGGMAAQAPTGRIAMRADMSYDPIV